MTSRSRCCFSMSASKRARSFLSVRCWRSLHSCAASDCQRQNGRGSCRPCHQERRDVWVIQRVAALNFPTSPTDTIKIRTPPPSPRLPSSACRSRISPRGSRAHRRRRNTQQRIRRRGFQKRPYSPRGSQIPTRPLFGDTHLHTSFSMDAGAAGCHRAARCVSLCPR